MNSFVHPWQERLSCFHCKFSSLLEDGNNNVPTTSDDTFAPSFFHGEIPAVGPQYTLFVPVNVLSLKPSAISVVLLGLDGAPCLNTTSRFVEFVAAPSTNGPVHPIGAK